MSDDARLEALQDTVEMQRLAISRLTTDLTSLADQTADSLALLHDQVDAVSNRSPNTWAPTGTGASAPWCWRDLDPDGRQQLLNRLAAWVGWLRERYPLTASIPSCWTSHPEMVEEVIAAHAAWTAAYETPDASPVAAAEWHDRWLPGLEHRLTTRWKSRRCETGHQPPRITATQGGTDGTRN